MFGLGPQEVILILIIALIIFGPKKLPEIGRSIGNGLRELRKASREMMNSIEEPEDDQDRKKETK